MPKQKNVRVAGMAVIAPSCGRLFRVERLGWVDRSGEVGGDVAGDERGSCEDDGDGDEDGYVPRLDVEEQLANEDGDGKGAEQSGGDSGGSEADGFAEDEAIDGAALRAERDADADLAGTLADGVGDDAIQSDHAQQQREACESADDAGGGPVQGRVRRTIVDGRTIFRADG